MSDQGEDCSMAVEVLDFWSDGVCKLRVVDNKYSGKTFEVCLVIRNRAVLFHQIKCTNPFLLPDEQLSEMLLNVCKHHLQLKEGE